ncbi:hypothetical protein ILUMI_00800 [Ignelater luminosus]|uniref:Reverse transcriptase domain-containing protein n=1 Tax=Ignelater luminosus TaxID=2038154 RepID=A0A8K0GKW1_IGNLU|nr:hypothetical protein ILUMI_00800 [Ignelater luminosus]
MKGTSPIQTCPRVRSQVCPELRRPEHRSVNPIPSLSEGLTTAHTLRIKYPAINRLLQKSRKKAQLEKRTPRIPNFGTACAGDVACWDTVDGSVNGKAASSAPGMGNSEHNPDPIPARSNFQLEVSDNHCTPRYTKKVSDRTQEDVNNIKNKNGSGRTQEDVDNTQKINDNYKKVEVCKKVILFSDSHGRNLAGILRSAFEKNKDSMVEAVQGNVKPNAKFKNVVDGSLNDINKLGSKDFAVILAGTTDFNYQEKLNLKDLLESFGLISLINDYTRIAKTANGVTKSAIEYLIINWHEATYLIEDTDSQHGYRDNYSTETAAVELVQSVNESLDKNKHVFGIFFDLTSAFDTLDISFLEIKLEKLGIRGKVLEWIISWMGNRQIRVKINEVIS